MFDITIIEDDYALNNGVSLALKSCGYHTEQLYKLSDFKKDRKTNLIILDINLPDGNGFAFLKDLRTTSNEYQDENYHFYFERMEFFFNDTPVELSKTEQKLLKILVFNRNQVVTREILIDRIWSNGAEFVDENALSVTVNRLRKKLDAGNRIQTVYGIGYTWRNE